MNKASAIPLFHKIVGGLKYLFLASLAMIFLVELGLSLRWRLLSDSAFLHYIAYLMNEHGFVPYRDIFDPNMPGTYLFHMAVGRLFGYSDFAFRLVDVAWLTVTLIVTWLIVKPVGRAAAFGSCVLFGLIYLGAGADMSLQRDVIAILPMATALLLVTQCSVKRSVHLIHFLLGVLFALAALFKPHMAIGLPVLIVYYCIHRATDRKSVKTLIRPCIVGSIFAFIGFLATLAIPFLWLWRIGALSAFWDIYSSYVPLYAQMSRDFVFRSPTDRLLNIVYWYIEFDGYGMLLTASLFGVYIVVTQATSAAVKKLAILLLVLTALYSVYVVIGGKFWPYHWMPCVYFSSLCAATLLFSPPSWANAGRPLILPLAVFIVTAMITTLLPAYDFAYQLVSGQPPAPPMDGRVDELAIYLDEHLAPTDTVQPLDWISGATHAMLIAKAVPATRYITDFQFYHHVSNPYMEKLKANFVEELKTEMPTYVIDVSEKPKLSGTDTTDEFPELRLFIQQHYQKEYAGNGFEIFRRDPE